MRTFRLYRFSVLLLPLLSLAACDFGSGGNGDQAQIRMLNVSTGYDSLDLYTNDNDDDDDSDAKQIEAVTYKTVSAYEGLDSDTYTLKFKKNAATSTLLTLSSENLTDESHATYVGYGSNGNFATIKIGEDQTDADSGDAKIALVNAGDAGSLDVYLTDDDISLDDASPTFAAVAAGTGSGTTTIDSGTYRLRVTGAGDTSDLRLDVASVTFDSTKVFAVILTATSGGVLVNAVLLPQQGNLTAFDNTKARIRGASGIATGNLVSLSVGSSSLLSNVAVGVIGNKYTQVEAGSLAIKLAVDGTSVSVPSQTLAAGADYTLLVYSDANGTQTNLITDNNRLPSSSSLTKIRLLNGMSGLSTPINLSVDNFPVVEGTALGQASDYVEVDSGTDLQIDVNETSTGISQLSRTGTLQANAVYTMFIAGGGTATTIANTLRKDR